MSGTPPRDPRLDLLIGLVGLWLAAGFLWDSWAHLHVAVETFFTPYHDVFYSAMLVGAGLVGLAAVRNRRRGYRGWNVVPKAYRLALLGIPIFFLGGIGDLIWHTVFGLEDRVDAVTSPTHLLIGIGVLTAVSAPLRSALEARERLTTLASQLPALFALATWLEFIHLGTAYAFDPGALALYAPPNGERYGVDYFTNTSFELYKTGSGIMALVLNAVILMAFVLWLVTRLPLRPGALTVFMLLGNGLIAAALTNDTPLLPIYLAASFVAGAVGDVLVARLRPAVHRPAALRTFAAIVPVAYYGTYFVATIIAGGTWWNWNLIFGALVWCATIGIGLAFVAGATRPPRPPVTVLDVVEERGDPLGAAHALADR